MQFIENLKEQFSFVRGNYLILIISWILMDFAGELPGTYYSDYVIQLGGSATILGLITLVSMLCLASVQFPRRILSHPRIGKSFSDYNQLQRWAHNQNKAEKLYHDTQQSSRLQACHRKHGEESLSLLASI
jgi:hypothetical protein